MRTLCAAILLLLTGTLPAQPISRIMFGSCLDESRAHPALLVAVAREPDLFLFLGDNVYADSPSEAVIRRSYQTLAASPLFQSLSATTRLLATWDDHDYGRNDAGRDFEAREASEQVFEEFWNVPDEVGERPGIYQSVTLGPPGRRVQIILLDTRYFRTPLSRARPRPDGKGPYAVQEGGGTILGESQWRWLSQALAEPAELRVIASSIQVLAEHHGWESWANFPHEQSRLLEMVANAGVPSVFVTGDRHFAEMSVQETDGDGGTVNLLDVTSSGINRRYPDPMPTANANRLGGYYLDHNVGELEITWPETDGTPEVRVRIYDASGTVRLEHRPRL